MSASAKDAAHAPGYGFGVYVHWPFCQAKCPYCDFNSHVWAEIDQARWGAALIQELAAMSLRTGPRAVDSVFFGGGTPSLMTPQTVSDLIEAIDDLWGLRAGAEITLEANPTSVEAEKFQGYRAAGVNRLSMGVQALNDADLKALGRLHTVREALAAFEIARAAFDRVSFDLIYARMGQTSQAWAAELDQALALAVDHLSLYQLTLEPGTPFHALAERGKLHTPPDDAAAEMFEITQTRCAAQGLPAYEISNHARPGAESRHNLVYWRMGDYVGAGPGAHGRLTTAAGRRATETIRDPAAWLAQVDARGDGLLSAETISPQDQAVELMVMGLRLTEGVEAARFEHLAGRPLDPARLADLETDGLLRQTNGRVMATPTGRLVLDGVLHALNL